MERHFNDAGIPAQFIGVVCGEDLKLPGEEPVTLAELKSAHENWFPGFMAQAAE
jgi:phosphoribosylformylglycinamidine synthase